MVELSPSWLTAVTEYVSVPAADVFSAPTPLVAPLLSVQEAIPGAPVLSAHEKDVGTVWPTVYVPPVVGVLIVAAGGARPANA